VRTLRVISLILVTCAVTASAVACDNNTPSAPSAPSAPVAPSAPTSGGGGTGSGAAAEQAAEQAVAKNWQTFFNAKTPPSKRVALLQDGPEFTALIEAESQSSLASEASATVTKVRLTSASQAQVSYTIELGGQPALSDQIGTAVLDNGVWKVGVGSFCNLEILMNGGSSSTLPQTCHTAPGG
jgi:hypothetical protein